MRTTIGKNLVIHDYSKEVLEFAENNLTFANPLYHLKVSIGKSTYGTPKDIVLYEKIGNDLILPYGALRNVYSLIKDAPIELNFKANTTKVLLPRTILRDYQKIALESIVKYKGGILKAPCGSGKTLIGMNLISRLSCRTLWIADTLKLVEQAKGVAEKEFINLEENDIGTITEGKVNVGNVLTFATIQTLHKIDLSKLENYFNLIIVDECHMISGTPTKITMYYKALAQLSAKYKYGLTATPKRRDGLEKCMFALLGNLAYEITDEMVEKNKIIAKLDVIDLPTEDNMYFYDTDYKFLQIKFDEFIATNKGRNARITNNIVKVYKEGNHHQLVLCSRVEQCKLLVDMLNEISYDCDLGMKVGLFVGSNSKKLNTEILENYEQYDIIVGTYAIANKGLDLPKLDRLHLASPKTKNNKALYKQCVGRIERYADGKRDSIVYAYCDNNIRFSRKATECVRLAMGIKKGYIFK